MASHAHQRPPSACSTRCSALTTARKDGGDPPVGVEHLPCVLRDFSDAIRRMIRRAFARAKLGPMARRLAECCPGVRRPGLWAVRVCLANDNHLGDDLFQEVSIALWQAMAEGRVRAARAFVHKWLTTTIWRISRRGQARDATLLAMVAAPTDDERLSDVHVPFSVPSDERAPREEERADPRLRYAAIVRENPGASARLSAAERAAFLPWIAGATNSEIAAELGISAVAVRLRLMRARRLLDKGATPSSDDVA